MSFLGGLWKIIQGKPVYDTSPPPQAPTPPGEPPEQIQGPLESSLESAPVIPVHTAQSAPQGTEAEASSIQKDNANTFPVAYIKRTITKLNGRDMFVYCYITNNSNMVLDIHKIHLLGREEEIKHPLKPGEEKEILVYEGPQLTSQADHQALLIYKTETGDYFEAIHEIRFMYNNATQTYSVDEIRLHLPIKDIYG